MNNDDTRRSINATLAELEQKQLPKLEILDRGVAPDSDAAEALAIVKRIEEKIVAVSLGEAAKRIIDRLESERKEKP